MEAWIEFYFLELEAILFGNANSDSQREKGNLQLPELLPSSVLAEGALKLEINGLEIRK